VRSKHSVVRLRLHYMWPPGQEAKKGWFNAPSTTLAGIDGVVKTDGVLREKIFFKNDREEWGRSPFAVNPQRGCSMCARIGPPRIFKDQK